MPDSIYLIVIAIIVIILAKVIFAKVIVFKLKSFANAGLAKFFKHEQNEIGWKNGK